MYVCMYVYLSVHRPGVDSMQTMLKDIPDNLRQVLQFYSLYLCMSVSMSVCMSVCLYTDPG